MASRNMLLLGIVALIVGYSSYIDFPEQCDFPLIIKFYYTLIRIVTNASSIWHFFGGSYVTLMRAMELDTSVVGSSGHGIHLSEHNFDGVPTTIFESKSDAKKDELSPAVIFYHGGGWAVGSVELYSQFAKSLAKHSGWKIVFPKYRLAPEYPYPAGLQDCTKATLAFAKQARKYGVDEDRLLFLGDSAGGNLATAVTMELAKNKNTDVEPCHLTLIYPLIQMSNFMLPSYRKNAQAPLLNPEIVARFVLLYMGVHNFTDLIPSMVHNLHMKDLKTASFASKIQSSLVPDKYKSNMPPLPQYAPTKRDLAKLNQYKSALQKYATDPLFSPLSANDSDLVTLPKTYILTSEHDVLRDDGLILFERMKALEMDVSYKNLEFAAHGMINLFGAGEYKKLNDAMLEMIAILREASTEC